MIVLRLQTHILEGEILGADFNGQRRILPRIKLATDEDYYSTLDLPASSFLSNSVMQ